MKTLADDWRELIAWFASDTRIAIGIFVLAFMTFGWFSGGAGWNQDAHFDLTRALVERGTLYIDGYESNTGDVSKGADGHIYINKPPAGSFLAAVPYAIVHAIAPRFDAQWLVTALTCGLCGALIGPILFLYGRKRVSARASLAVTLAILFGTIVFPYSTMLFAHVPTALFLLLAVINMRDRPLLAGAAAGIATSSFYVCAVAVLIIAIASPTWRTRLRFIAGGAPFAVLLAIYQWRCFGSPFKTAVEASTPFTEKGLLFGVLRLPRLGALYGITFSPYRGLFFVAPVLLFAFIGLRRMERTREWWAITGSIAAFFIAIASFNQWHGGWAFGPRYVLPVVPLFGIPMMYAMPALSRRMRMLFIVAAVVSIGVNFLATAVDPMPTSAIDNPLTEYLVPAFFTGEIPAETRDSVPWFNDTHVKPVAIPRDSTNLGELAFSEGSRLSILPIALWMLGGTIVLTLAASKRP